MKQLFIIMMAMLLTNISPAFAQGREVANAPPPGVLYFQLNKPLHTAQSACKRLGGDWKRTRDVKETNFVCSNTRRHMSISVTADSDDLIQLLVFGFHEDRPHGFKAWDNLLKRFQKDYADSYNVHGKKDTHEFWGNGWAAFFSFPKSDKNTHTIWMYDVHYLMHIKEVKVN